MPNSNSNVIHPTPNYVLRSSLAPDRNWDNSNTNNNYNRLKHINMLKLKKMRNKKTHWSPSEETRRHSEANSLFWKLINNRKKASTDPAFPTWNIPQGYLNTSYLDTEEFQLINEKEIKELEYHHSALKELTERGNASVTNTPKGKTAKYLHFLTGGRSCPTFTPKKENQTYIWSRL